MFYRIPVVCLYFLLPVLLRAQLGELPRPLYTWQASDAQTASFVNFHPARLAAHLPDTLHSEELLAGAHGFTLFVVYVEQDTLSEKAVCWIQRDNQAPLLLTSRRMADLQRQRYTTLPGGQSLLPQVLCYTERFGSSTMDGLRLHLARMPGSPKLPLRTDGFLLAEWQLYDSVLSPLQRSIVQSHLSLKYGTLHRSQEPIEYLDSRGKLLWSADRAAEYMHTVAALGRADALGWRQAQARYQVGGVLEMAVDSFYESTRQNPSALRENEYLLWSSNGRAPELEEDPETGISWLNRSWRVRTTPGFLSSPLVLRWARESLQVDWQLPGQWFLAIDASGTDRFAAEKVQLIPLQSTSAFLIATDIQLNADRSSTNHFRLLHTDGPAVLLEKELPDCTTGRSGQLTVRPVGLHAPFHIQLKAADDRRWEQQSEGAAVQFSDLPSGIYSLQVTDDLLHMRTIPVYLSAVDTFAPFLPDTLRLSPKKATYLELPPNHHTDWQMSWITPQGKSISEPRLLVESAGIYVLELRRQQCRSYHAVSVLPSRTAQQFERIRLYPNPAQDGPFTLDVLTTKAAALRVRLFSETGQQLLQRDLPPARRHQLQHHIQVAGSYLLQLRSGTASRTLKLVVE